MITLELQKTSRREAREGYVRYLLHRAGFEEIDIDEFLTTKQAALENKSPLELIYTGEYDRAVHVVEQFTDKQPEEE